MLKKVAFILIGLLLMQHVVADTVAVRPDYPEKYIVVKGDTLWDITAHFLSDPWRWPEVWQWNPHIENPHLIYPGDEVSLSYQDGQPVLKVQHKDMQQSTSSSAGGASPEALGDREKIKLSPRIRVRDKPTAVLPLISLDAIKHFLTYPRIVSENYLESLPYIVANDEERKIAATGNKVYIKRLRKNTKTRQFSIYRKGQVYRDLTRGKNRVLGYEAIYVGDLVVEKGGNPAVATITSINREVLVGDRLVAKSDVDVSELFKPALPGRQIKGHILAIYDGLSQAGKNMIVALNMGARDGLSEGSVLGIYRRGATVDDPIASADNGWVTDVSRVKLPEKKIGTAMVFKTHKRFSYGIILSSTGRIQVFDRIKNL